MSVEASSWAWKQAIPAGPKLVLLCLADHSDRSGICWPGQAEVAEKCRMNRSTVNQHIRLLRDLELIEERKRGDAAGHRISSLYILDLSRVVVEGDSKVGDSKVGDSKVGDSKVGNPQVGDSKVGNPQVGISQPKVGISGTQSWESQQESSKNRKEPSPSSSGSAFAPPDPAPAASNPNGKKPTWETATTGQRVDRILKLLNGKTGANFQSMTAAGKPTAAYKLIEQRIKDGHGWKDFCTVILDRVEAWGNDDRMRPFLRPKTLFAKSNFEDYLGQGGEA